LAGPEDFEASTRSSLSAERQRAKTDSPISVTGMAEVERADHGPLAGALLAGGVENLVDERRAVFVLLGEDVLEISMR
jgi:hypothetical protein